MKVYKRRNEVTQGYDFDLAEHAWKEHHNKRNLQRARYKRKFKEAAGITIINNILSEYSVEVSKVWKPLNAIRCSLITIEDI